MFFVVVERSSVNSIGNKLTYLPTGESLVRLTAITSVSITSIQPVLKLSFPLRVCPVVADGTASQA